MNIENLGLGRLFKPDERDKGFLMSSRIPAEMPPKKFKYWHPSFWWGDQGNTPHCVGYSWVHWLAEGPFTQSNSRNRNSGVPYNPDTLYHQAQKVDEWVGEAYYGTSVRAGAKVLQSAGFISSYYWAWNIEDVVNTLLHVSPVVVGTLWTNDMFYPNLEGIIKFTGRVAGGHAYLLDGINVEKGLIRIKNSWGRGWAKNGFAYISLEDMDRLIAYDGEACIAGEINKL